MNEGVITCRHVTTTANIFLKMPADGAQTQIAAFTIPNNETGLLKRVRKSIGRASGASGSANYSIRIRTSGGAWRTLRNDAVTTQAPVNYTMLGGEILPEKTDIKLRMESVSDNNTFATGIFEILLIKDGAL